MSVGSKIFGASEIDTLIRMFYAGETYRDMAPHFKCSHTRIFQEVQRLRLHRNNQLKAQLKRKEVFECIRDCNTIAEAAAKAGVKPEYLKRILGTYSYGFRAIRHYFKFGGAKTPYW